MATGRFAITLINPNIVVQRHDMMTTGIVYMPISLAYFAAALRKAGLPPQVIDAFGEAPNQIRREGGRLFRGLSPADVIRRVSPDTGAVVLYAGQVANHQSLTELIGALKRDSAARPVIVMENTQAVTAYALAHVQDDLYAAGADYLITGESERRGVELIQALAAQASPEGIERIDGIGGRVGGRIFYTPPAGPLSDLDALDYPAWDLFPLRNYWNLRYAHGPLSAPRYLPLLTSRGCPYPCRFCVIPETNSRKWRARRPEAVAAEIQHFYETLGVPEYHIEDVDPTIDDERTRRFCEDLIRRRLPVTWKICAGTKVESIKDEATLERMAASGCRYISISPESGSPRVMQLIGKPFNLEHAKRSIAAMNRLGIRSQACFVLGYPGEEDADRALSLRLVTDLTRFGVDEIAVFIISPVPGAAIYSQFTGFDTYSDLTFSPSWRQDYPHLSRWRRRFYRSFLLNKLLFHPVKFLAQPFRFLARRFQTKMEMVPYRALHTFLLQWRHHGR